MSEEQSEQNIEAQAPVDDKVVESTEPEVVSDVQDEDASSEPISDSEPAPEPEKPLTPEEEVAAKAQAEEVAKNAATKPVKAEAEPPPAPAVAKPPAHTSGALVEEPHARGKIYSSVLAAIGTTPLVRLPRLCEKHGVAAEILAKLDFMNPSGSSKDRTAFAMIEDAERQGRIKPGETILIEPTSGNTGISLAMVAAAKGYQLILVMPESISIERRKFLRHLGAKVETSPADAGMKGAAALTDRLLKHHKGSIQISQFTNPANPQIHAETPAEEIWADCEGRVDAVVMGVGSGGTLTGVAKGLKAKNPNIMIFAVEPAGSAVLSGKEAGGHKIQGIGAGFVPDVLDASLINSVVAVGDEQAFEMARDAAKTEGLPCGISSGAVLMAALEVGKLDGFADKRIVAMLPSAAERYSGSELFD